MTAERQLADACGDALLVLLVERLGRIRYPMSPQQAAARLQTIAETLVSGGEPPAELFVLAAAIGLAGAAAATARAAARTERARAPAEPAP